MTTFLPPVRELLTTSSASAEAPEFQGLYFLLSAARLGNEAPRPRDDPHCVCLWQMPWEYAESLNSAVPVQPFHRLAAVLLSEGTPAAVAGYVHSHVIRRPEDRRGSFRMMKSAQDALEIHQYRGCVSIRWWM